MPNKFRNLLEFMAFICRADLQEGFWIFFVLMHNIETYLYRLQIFPPRETRNNECKIFGPL